MAEIGTTGIHTIDEAVANALEAIELAAAAYREVVGFDLSDDAGKLEAAAAILREVVA